MLTKYFLENKNFEIRTWRGFKFPVFEKAKIYDL